jgi:hypothetical protein
MKVTEEVTEKVTLSKKASNIVDWDWWTGNMPPENQAFCRPHDESAKGEDFRFNNKCIAWLNLGPKTNANDVLNTLKLRRKATTDIIIEGVTDADLEDNGEAGTAGNEGTAGGAAKDNANTDGDGNDGKEDLFRFHGQRQIGSITGQPRQVYSVREFLKCVPIFFTLNSEDFAMLEESSTVLDFKDGDMIVEPEQILDSVYVVLNGNIGVEFEKNDQDDMSPYSSSPKVRTLNTKGKDGEGSDENEDERSELHHVLSTGDAFGTFAMTRGASRGYYRCRGDVTVLSVPIHMMETVTDMSKESISSKYFCFTRPVREPDQASFEELSLYEFVEHAQDLLDTYRRHSPAMNVQESDDVLDALNNIKSQRSSVRTSVGDGAVSRGNTQTRRRRASTWTAPSPQLTLPDDEYRLLKGKVSGLMETDKKKVLLSILSLCVPGLEFDESLHQMLCLIRDFFGVDRVKFGIVVNSHLVIRSSQYEADEEAEMPMKGFAHLVVSQGVILNVEDCREDPSYNISIEEPEGYVVKQLLCVPMNSPMQNGKTGVLYIQNKTDGKPFSYRDEEFAVQLAQLFGSLVHLTQDKTSLIEAVPITNIDSHFMLKMNGVTFSEPYLQIRCKVTIIYNTTHVGPTIKTDYYQATPISESIYYSSFNCDVEHEDVFLKTLPYPTKLLFQFYAKSGSTPIGWSMINVFNIDRLLRTGPMTVTIEPGAWPEKDQFLRPSHIHPKGTPVTTPNTFTLEFPVFENPLLNVNAFLAFKNDEQAISRTATMKAKPLDWYISRMNSKEKSSLDKVLSANFMTGKLPVLTEEDRKTMWALRYSMVPICTLLPFFLYSIDWADPVTVGEANRMMKAWSPLELVQVFQLLSGSFPDPPIRSYAVSLLTEFDDSTVLVFLPFLCRMVYYESCPDSALARFLFSRALENPEFGHAIYWRWKADFQGNSMSNGLFTLQDIYARYCGFRVALGHQESVLERLIEVALATCGKTLEGDNDTPGLLVQLIGELNWQISNSFTVPVAWTSRFIGFDAEASKWSAERRNSMHLVLEGAEREKVPILFTHLASLEWYSEQAATQLVSVCNQLWDMAGVDMSIQSYSCMVGSDGTGMLRMLDETVTLDELAGLVAEPVDLESEIDNQANRKEFFFGGKKYAKDFIVKSFEFRDASMDLSMMTDSFMRSCAAFCVLNIVFGIGERNGSNIFLSPYGEICENDLGASFLGLNRNNPYGVRMATSRDFDANACLLPAFVEVMGGEDSIMFGCFMDLCVSGYICLRKHMQLLLTLLHTRFFNFGLSDDQRDTAANNLCKNLMITEDDLEVTKTIRGYISKSVTTYSATGPILTSTGSTAEFKFDASPRPFNAPPNSPRSDAGSMNSPKSSFFSPRMKSAKPSMPGMVAEDANDVGSPRQTDSTFSTKMPRMSPRK